MKHQKPTPIQDSLFFWMILAVLPLAFIPYFVAPATTFRLHALVWTGFFAAIWWAVRLWKTKKVEFWFSSKFWIWLVIPILGIFSALITPTPLSQLGPNLWSLIGIGITTFFVSQIVTQWSQQKNLLTWGAVSWVIAIVFWWQLTPWPLSQLLNATTSLPLANNITFSLFPSIVAVTTFLISILAAFIIQFFVGWEDEKQSSSNNDDLVSPLATFAVSTILFIGITLFALGYQLWQNENVRPTLLHYSEGWSIALEQFKEPRSLLLGVGPERFPYAYNIAKSAFVNSTEYWNVPMITSSSHALHVATTLGLPAVVAWVAAFWMMAQTIRKSASTYKWAFLGILAVQFAHFLFLPFTIVNYILLAGLGISILIQYKNETSTETPVHFHMGLNSSRSSTLQSSSTVARIFGIIVILCSTVVLWWSSRDVAAHAYFFQSLQALQNEDAQTAFMLRQKMVRMAPFSPEFRTNYAETNYLIAQSILRNENSTEQQQQTGLALLQEALRSARVATEIEPAYHPAWALQGRIYTDLRQSEGGADWALAALSRSAELNPVDPRERINIANFMRIIENPNQAARLYEQAIQLKPDWNVAYYLYADLLLAEENRSDQTVPVAYQLLLQSRNFTPTSDPLYEVLEQNITTIEPEALELIQQQKAAATQSGELASPSVVQNPPEKPSIPDNALPEVPLPEQQPSFDALLNSDDSATPSAENSGTSEPLGSNENENIVLPELE